MLGDCLSLGVSESKNYLWSGSPYFSLKTILSLSDKLIPGSVELISSEMATGVFSGFILKVVFGNVLLFCVAIFFSSKKFWEHILTVCIKYPSILLILSCSYVLCNDEFVWKWMTTYDWNYFNSKDVTLYKEDCPYSNFHGQLFSSAQSS